MEFLKEILGEDLFSQVSEKVNAFNGNEANKDKQVKIGNLASGEYVGKGKFMQASREAAKLSYDDNAARDEVKKTVEANAASFKAGVTDAVTEFMVRYQISEGNAYLDGLKGLGIDTHISD